ncbi:MAG: hypothetical protein ACI828_000643 [Flavobacteriales bacterium]|jgi:hypothetical protein
MRHFIYLICILFVFGSCSEQQAAASDLSKFIPRKAAVIIKTQDLKGLRSQLHNNDFAEALVATPIFDFFKEQGVLLDNLNPQGTSLICYTPIGKDDYEVSLITKVHKGLWKSDSTKTTISSKTIQGFKTENRDYFYLLQNEIVMISTSQLLLENTLREADEDPIPDPYFDRAYSTTSSNATSILVRGQSASGIWQDLFPKGPSQSLTDTFSWASVDLDASQNDIKLSGVLLVQDSVDLKLDLLRGTLPVTNTIANITPLSAQSVTSITYTDWEVFKNNQSQFLKVDPTKFNIQGDPYLSSFQEVGHIILNEGEAIIGVSLDPTLTLEGLSGSKKTGTFRQFSLFEMEEKNAFAKAYTPLLSLPSVKLYCQMDNFFIFTENQEVLESIIANYQNNATLAKSETFKNTARLLSSASSLLHIEFLNQGRYKQWRREKAPKITLEGYPYLTTQLIQERNFLHFNLVVNKNELPDAQGAVSQIANVKLNNDILMAPQLVKNHRSKGMDVVVQDINNTLYLISNSGKVLWQKELDSPIQGDVQQVDLYRNGRLQLAFNTENTFYILDRNGKEVKPFPISFQNPITQPLAVFDYENNRNYRFLIVQNDALNMYDKNAKPVNGFVFDKAGSSIIQPPQHIRISNKDYILVTESNGTLNILSRTGKSRIDVKETIDFGDTPVLTSDNKFLIYNVNGDKITIGTNGTMIENATNIGSGAAIIQSGSTLVSLRENDLQIKGIAVALPFGMYTSPSIATIRNKKYIAVTNIETSEAYIFDTNGKELDNFPVYGISTADIGLLERNKGLGFVTQGDSQSILIYKIN